LNVCLNVAGIDLGNKELTCVVLLLILLISTFITAIPQLTASVTVQNHAPAGTKDGNRVYIDTKDAYISTSPHTITADGYLYINVTSKTYGGTLDLCFGFENTNAYPGNLEVYAPKSETTCYKLNLTSYLAQPDKYTVMYNATKSVGNILYDGVVTVQFQESEQIDNKTVQNETKTLLNNNEVIAQRFDVAYLDINMFYWNTTLVSEWSSVRAGGNYSKCSCLFQNVTTWYLADIFTEQNSPLYFRVWITLIPTLNTELNEFYVALKPHSDSLTNALINNRFSCLDPWYSTQWDCRKSGTISNSTGAGPRDYQVRIQAHSGSGTDSANNVYLNGYCRSDFGDVRFTNGAGDALLDYWLENITDDVATFWVEVYEDLSSTERLIYIYYGNPVAATTSNQFTTGITQLREQRGSSQYGPEFTFSIDNGEWLKIDATQWGYGLGYAFFVVPKSWVNGMYLAWEWQGTWSSPTYGYEWCVRIYDGAYLRSKDSDFPTIWSPATKGVGLIQSYDRSADYSFSPEYVEFQVNVDSAVNDYVTIFLMINDAWIDEWMFGLWNYVEFNAGPYPSGSVAYVNFITILGTVNMEQTGTTSDYGLVRKYTDPEPQVFSWGAEEGQGHAPSAWAPYNWEFRKSHTICHSTGAGQHYAIRVHVWSSSGTDCDENVYCDGCNWDFGDIRFTDNDGYTLLSYWIESWAANSNAVFWVNVQDDLSDVDATIYVYYGNEYAQSISTESNTFLYAYADDFEPTSNFIDLHESMWSVSTANAFSATHSLEFPYTDLPVTGLARHSQLITFPSTTFVIESRFWINNFFYNDVFHLACFISPNSALVGPHLAVLNGQLQFHDGAWEPSNWYVPNQQWVYLRLIVKPSSSNFDVYSSTDGISWTFRLGNAGYIAALSGGSSCYVAAFGAHSSSYNGVSLRYGDNYLWRKYVSPEPQHGTWGAAEQLAITASFWGTGHYIFPTNSTEAVFEKNLSGNTTIYLWDLFNDTERYDPCDNFWGQCTTPPNFYIHIHAYDQEFSFNTLFYKGHTRNGTIVTNHNGTNHYTIYGYTNNTYDQIYDTDIYASIVNHQFYFVFLWTCQCGNEKGGWNATSQQPWGMPYAFMGSAVNDMSEDGYTNSSDDADRCFISFQHTSMNFYNRTGYSGGYQYAHFVYEFYQYLLDGHTVNDAINSASINTCGSDFEDCELNTGYVFTTYFEDRPPYPDADCRLRIFGDGNMVIPR
jgi:hypothetical protein